jgi:hypothetical protein
MLHRRTSLPPRRRPGVVAVLVAASLVVILGVAAIALDGGLLINQRRWAQATADAAALAAAADLFENYPANGGQDPQGTARASALALAAANGYGNDGQDSIVTVNISPQRYQGGPKAGQILPPGYVEVLVQYNQKRGFSNVFGSGDLTVGARAVARGRWVGVPSVVTLDLSAFGALSIFNGNGDVQVTTGTVVVNSRSPQAAFNGTAANITAPEFQLVGNYGTVGLGTFVGDVQTGVRPTPDPLRFLAPPDPNLLSPQVLPNPVNGVYYLQPGRYFGGLSFSGTDRVEMAAGIYYMDQGGFTFTGSGTLTGQGVMIYNAPANIGQGITLSSVGSATLSPPTDGPYQGLVFFQDRESTANVVLIHRLGTGTFDISGVVYAANAPVLITRTLGDVGVGSQFISRTLFLTGSGLLKINGNIAKTRVFGLVE